MGIETSPGCFVITYPSEDIAESAQYSMDGATMTAHGREFRIRSSVLRGVVLTDSESSDDSMDLVVDDSRAGYAHDDAPRLVVEDPRDVSTNYNAPRENPAAAPRPGASWRESQQASPDRCGPALALLNFGMNMPRVIDHWTLADECSDRSDGLPVHSEGRIGPDGVYTTVII